MSCDTPFVCPAAGHVRGLKVRALFRSYRTAQWGHWWGLPEVFADGVTGWEPGEVWKSLGGQGHPSGLGLAHVCRCRSTARTLTCDSVTCDCVRSGLPDLRIHVPSVLTASGSLPASGGTGAELAYGLDSAMQVGRRAQAGAQPGLVRADHDHQMVPGCVVGRQAEVDDGRSSGSVQTARSFGARGDAKQANAITRPIAEAPHWWTPYVCCHRVGLPSHRGPVDRVSVHQSRSPRLSSHHALSPRPVLRRVMRDTRPPDDLRQPKHGSPHESALTSPAGADEAASLTSRKPCLGRQ
jgi:hypothetical protein